LKRLADTFDATDVSITTSLFPWILNRVQKGELRFDGLFDRPPAFLGSFRSAPWVEEVWVFAQWVGMKRRRHRFTRQERGGAIIVLAAFMMVIMLGFCAFAVDLGYVANTRTELCRAVDAGALAGATVLPQGLAATTPIVRQYLKANIVGAREIADDEIELDTGHWDSQVNRFVLSSHRPTALRVVVERPGQPLFFGLAIGKREFELRAEAIAEYQPRDIMLALGPSSAASDGRTFAALSTRGRAAIEADLLEVYGQLGRPTYGNMTFSPRFIGATTAAQIKGQLGLSGVAYPYPRGSWDEFIHHVTSNKDLQRAGYHRQFGYMTLIHYWLVDRPKPSETPALQSSARQSNDALFNSVDRFLSFMKSQQTNDRLGLSFNPHDARIPAHALTPDFDAINETMRSAHSGLPGPSAKIVATLRTSREELEKHARSGALRMIVLMTGGIAAGPLDEDTAKENLLSEAEACAAANIRVCAISPVTGADDEIMQRVAKITGGKHFGIADGQPGEEYCDNLEDVLERISRMRPVRLVQ
jgi:hypothetical protein